MNLKLKKRITTSVILFLFTIFCIFINPYVFIIAIIIVSYLSWYETKHLINSINKSVTNWQRVVFNLTTLFYAFGIFTVSAIGLYFLLGPVFFLYALSVCICSDIGGYIIGKNIGGKKLTKISPNKTISGSLGSFCFSMLPLLVFNNFDKFEYYLYSIDNFLFCLKVSLVCQLGDLFVSYFKRKAKVKDTGRILPGHGGMLDRIDGIIFAVPFVFMSIVGFNNFYEKYFDIFFAIKN
jgi:phosphatidate cytidylyltransferase|tara:strand:+ start:353 stop:1063 length:711 start_codon:yes stop_codon:yes gene_type:complete